MKLIHRGRPMNKIIFVLALGALVAGSVVSNPVLAQEQAHNEQMRWRPSAADRLAFANARIAALHAGLALNADQEKLWPPVEAALRDIAKKRAERFEAMRAQREKAGGKLDPMFDLHRRAESMVQRGSDLKRLADAAQPLYDKLDDAQKNRLQILLHHGMREHGMRRFGELPERFRQWREGHADRRL